MREALYTLAGEGKRVLEKAGSEDIVLERRPPLQLDHFVGVNEVRLAVEIIGGVSYFFAYWELARLDWCYPIIPDAVFSFGNRTFAVEFDRGLESIRFFMRTKITVYRRGFDRFPLAAVLIVTDRKARMESLAKAVADQAGRFLFSTLDLVTQHGMTAPIFFRQPHGEGVSLV